MDPMGWNSFEFYRIDRPNRFLKIWSFQKVNLEWINTFQGRFCGFQETRGGESMNLYKDWVGVCMEGE